MNRKPDLQDFLPYLLNRAGLQVGLMFSRDIEHLDVTLPMWRVMVELWHRGDHRLGELAERTNIDLSTLSRLLVTMQRRQIIVRRRSGVDARALSLSLTDRGVALTEQIAPLAFDREEIALRGISTADVRKLRTLLKKIHANLAASRREPGPAIAGGRRAAKPAAPFKGTAHTTAKRPPARPGRSIEQSGHAPRVKKPAAGNGGGRRTHKSRGSESA